MAAAEVSVPCMPLADARRITERIRLMAHTARESIVELHALVGEAKVGNAHLTMGYQSWTAYLSEVLSEEPLRLAKDQRQELVGFLAGEGMSTRAIAPIVGVTQQQVSRDVNEVTPDVSPEDAPIEAEIVEDEPARVAGLDGKSYPKPAAVKKPAASKTPKRRSLVDQARDAGQELRKAVERLERIAADDRFNRNKNEVAAQLRHHLDHALKVCQDLSDSIN